jgi:hypothetical protein
VAIITCWHAFFIALRGLLFLASLHARNSPCRLFSPRQEMKQAVETPEHSYFASADEAEMETGLCHRGPEVSF